MNKKDWRLVMENPYLNKPETERHRKYMEKILHTECKVKIVKFYRIYAKKTKRGGKKK